MTMTAYDLMCKRNYIDNMIDVLCDYMGNTTSTVLLENDEVEDIKNCLREAREFMDFQLNKIVVE